MNKTLIITAAVGYTDQQVEASPFIQSLNACVENGGEVQVRTIRDVPQEFRGIAVQSWWRFEALRILLSEFERKDFDNIILTDFRDVIFQKHPGEIPVPHYGVACFFEDDRMTVKSCSYNSLWIQRDYGMDTFSKYGNRNISCCGVVIGSHSGMQEYLEYVTKETKRLDKWEVGIDTSVHNVGMWERKFPFESFQNENPWVYTVGHCLSIRVAKKRILNRKGQIPVIVHQWDRHI